MYYIENYLGTLTTKSHCGEYNWIKISDYVFSHILLAMLLSHSTCITSFIENLLVSYEFYEVAGYKDKKNSFYPPGAYNSVKKQTCK